MKTAKKTAKKTTKPAAKKAAVKVEVNKIAKQVDKSALLEAIEVPTKGKGLDIEFGKIIKTLPDLKVKLPGGILIPGLGGDPGAEVPGAEPEPVYDAKKRAAIQGNIIPGFNKDHQHFLFFCMGDIKRTKEWLKWIAPFISSMEDVLAWVRAYRAMKARLGEEPPMCATWVNIAFSNAAIAALTSKNDAAAFGDQSFKQGLAQRSTYLGDPTKSTHPGHRKHWVVGGPKNEADIVVIVAADDVHDLVNMTNAIKNKARAARMHLLFEQRGDTLPGNLRGHEHFGFKDGVSQVGVRGKVSSAPGDFITPRYLDPADSRAKMFAKPGQLLVWPGQFLLGEARQNTENLTASGPASVGGPPNFPHWAALGSYLVCRRLRQDVPAFWHFAAAAAATVGLSPLKFASMLVGRWPSGAPLMRSPAADNLTLAGDEFADNHFLFEDNTRPSALRPIPGYGGDAFAQASADVLGTVCPHFAHIRKTNPRDIATDLGKPHDTALRHVLRRGIPFGKPIFGVKKPPPGLMRQERGLMFLCYGSTIEDQFEFITRRWSNSPLHPNLGGHDPIIGQADHAGARTRFIDFPTAAGMKRLKIKHEWVIPTGGGYFFAPPIPAIAGVLGA
jgi:Dyp-type peroxidase family